MGGVQLQSLYTSPVPCASCVNTLSLSALHMQRPGLCNCKHPGRRTVHVEVLLFNHPLTCPPWRIRSTPGSNVSNVYIDWYNTCYGIVPVQIPKQGRSTTTTMTSETTRRPQQEETTNKPPETARNTRRPPPTAKHHPETARQTRARPNSFPRSPRSHTDKLRAVEPHGMCRNV